MSSFYNHDQGHDLFSERLQRCVGAPWTLWNAQYHLDALVLQPLPDPSDPSDQDAASFADFLARTFHRRLVRCFLGEQHGRLWTREALMKQTRPPSLQALTDALGRCVSWQIARERETPTGPNWQGHLRLSSLANFGWTFEWVVQTILERDYQALVRRHVILGERVDLGEIDVLALLGDGRSLLVECKSSSKGVTNQQLDRFVAKGQGFPADRALLLIDTDDPQQMRQRLGQLGQAMERAFGDATIEAPWNHEGSLIVHLRDHLFVADTGGGIAATLQGVLKR